MESFAAFVDAIWLRWKAECTDREQKTYLDGQRKMDQRLDAQLKTFSVRMFLTDSDRSLFSGTIKRNRYTGLFGGEI